MRNGSATNGEMPFSEDAERALICSVLLGGDRVAVELSVPKGAFYSPANQLVWDTLTDLLAERRSLDFTVVKHRLSVLDQLDEVGGVEYLNELYGFIQTSQNYQYYSDIVLDNWRLRNAIEATKELLQKLEQRGKATWADLRQDVESGLMALIKDGPEHELSTKEITMRWFDELATRKERLQRDGIAFGLPGLDKRLGYQQPGELVTIGAATSRGKSMLAYQGIVWNAGTRGLPVGLVSLEMTATQTWDRLASHMKQISMSRFREADFREEDQAKLMEFNQRMATEMPLYFSERRMDIEGIKSWGRRMRARHGIKLLVVDYLQRVGVPKSLMKASRQEQVSYISSELKSLALELELVIWCPVQLNRDGDVRESATIEFDSDIYIQIDLSDKAKVAGNILFMKVRQAERAEPLPVMVKGWIQTIEERKKGDSNEG